MTEKVIKNPNRDKQKPIKREDYIPEHQRLMKEPKVWEIDNSTVEAKIKEDSKRRVLNSNITASQPVAKPVATNAKSNVLDVGGSDDLQWSRAVNTKELSNLERRLQEEEAEQQEANKPILADEIVVPEDFGEYENEDSDEAPDNLSDEEDKDDLTEESDELKLADVGVGEYILFLNDQVVAYGTLVKIKETFEDILKSEDFSEYSADDFVILKRVSVKFGVMIDE